MIHVNFFERWKAFEKLLVDVVLKVFFVVEKVDATNSSKRKAREDSTDGGARVVQLQLFEGETLEEKVKDDPCCFLGRAATDLAMSGGVSDGHLCVAFCDDEERLAAFPGSFGNCTAIIFSVCSLGDAQRLPILPNL